MMWLDPAKVEIKSIDITASSSHEKWAGRSEERIQSSLAFMGFRVATPSRIVGIKSLSG